MAEGWNALVQVLITWYYLLTHSVPLHLQSHPLRPAWVPATLRNPQLPSIVPFKANNSTQRGTRHGPNRRDRKCARQHHILVSPFPSHPVLTQCSEDDLSAAKSVAATNRGDRELILSVRRQVLEDDGFTFGCHSNNDSVTWINAWLSSCPFFTEIDCEACAIIKSIAS